MRIVLTTLIAFTLCMGATMDAGDQKKKLPDPTSRKDAILALFVTEFVPITPGKDKFPESFMMGSGKGGHDNERPAHKVTFKYPFALAKYEVTQELYQVVMGKNPAQFQGLRNGMDRVNWAEANEFCEKATKMLRDAKFIKGSERIRLPSEAEWEYCCRAGTTTVWSFGDDVKELGKYSWFKDNSAKEDPPVGKKLPNPWGLYDMHGYVWEWCADAWHPSYEGAPNDGNAVWSTGDSKERVIRGGAYPDEPDLQRSAYRGHAETTKKSGAIGFRCVKDSLKTVKMTVGSTKRFQISDKRFRSMSNPNSKVATVVDEDGPGAVLIYAHGEGTVRIVVRNEDSTVEVVEVTVVPEPKK